MQLTWSCGSWTISCAANARRLGGSIQPLDNLSAARAQMGRKCEAFATHTHPTGHPSVELAIIAIAVTADALMRIEKVWTEAKAIPMISGLAQAIAAGLLDRIDGRNRSVNVMANGGLRCRRAQRTDRQDRGGRDDCKLAHRCSPLWALISPANKRPRKCRVPVTGLWKYVDRCPFCIPLHHRSISGSLVRPREGLRMRIASANDLASTLLSLPRCGR